MKKIYKPKTIITIFVSTFIIVLALFGSSWQIGFAETAPTIPPTIYDFNPKQICVNSSDTVITVEGYDFIDITNTWIVWVDSSYNHSYIIPDEIIVLDPFNMYLKFTVDAPKLTQVGDAWFYIDNYPDILYGNIGPYSVEIIACNYIYLPLLMK
jgi:hypothetical protein